MAVLIALVGLASFAAGLYFIALTIIRLARHQTERAFDAVIVALPLEVVANLSMDVWRALVAR